MFTDAEPSDSDPTMHEVCTVLTSDERHALASMIVWGIYASGWNSAGPGRGTDEPLYTACQRLGLNLHTVNRRVGVDSSSTTEPEGVS